jgi:hypothetical protein
MREPQPTLSGLLAYLGLDASPETVVAMVETGSETKGYSRVHVTAGSPDESIGRWEREGDDSFRRLADEHLGDVLEGFGYPPTAR